MAYKSNKQARAEYLANEGKNRDRNRRTHERRKERESSSSIGKVVLFLIIAAIVVQYLNTHRGVQQQSRVTSVSHVR